MTLLKTRLSLDDFMLEMMHLPVTNLRLMRLQAMMACLQLSDELLRQHIAFSDRTYTRKLVCRTPRFELLVLSWQPGQASTIHDHADSLNVTYVYEGTLTSREFTQTSEGIQQLRELQVKQGTGVAVDRYAIHQLANTSADPVVTLHVYALPLQEIQVYCPDSDRVQRVICPLASERD